LRILLEGIALMIHIIRFSSANSYIVQGTKTVLVDTGAPNSATRILAELQRLQIAPKDVSLILLTHGHSDHAGSAAALRETLQVPIAIHAEDVPLVEKGQNGAFTPMGMEASMSRPFVDRPFPSFRPDLLLEEGRTLTEFGLEARLLHTPGHSNGSVSLRFPDGDAIVGDILRGGMMGGMVFSGRPTYPYFMPTRDNLPQLRQSIVRVLESGAQRLMVGHGGPIAAKAVVRWLAR
jgi:hydroxyacylglutathione hydrolase